MNFRVLFQDEHLVAIDKPAGYHVHPPEDRSHRISRNTNALHLLRKQLNRYLYPVHRLDRSTSGVLLFALQPDTASELGRMFREQEIQKTYVALVRGWVPERGLIDHVLASEHDRAIKKEARTRFERLATVELPFAVSRHPSSRYSWVLAEPLSGRMHQIRRHFDHLSHPLIGDTVYGDGKHNRFFRDEMGLPGLFLKAYSVRFSHPVTRIPLHLRSRWGGTWIQAFDRLGVCPWVPT